jgi:hypothetical protein
MASRKGPVSVESRGTSTGVYTLSFCFLIAPSFIVSSVSPFFVKKRPSCCSSSNDSSGSGSGSITY